VIIFETIILNPINNPYLVIGFYCKDL